MTHTEDRPELQVIRNRTRRRGAEFRVMHADEREDTVFSDDQLRRFEAVTQRLPVFRLLPR